MAHESRSKKNRGVPPSRPTEDQIKWLRTQMNITIGEAAKLVYTNPQKWEQWESGEDIMHVTNWMLMLIYAKTIYSVELPENIEKYLETTFKGQLKVIQ